MKVGAHQTLHTGTRCTDWACAWVVYLHTCMPPHQHTGHLSTPLGQLQGTDLQAVERADTRPSVVRVVRARSGGGARHEDGCAAACSLLSHAESQRGSPGVRPTARGCAVW